MAWSAGFAGCLRKGVAFVSLSFSLVSGPVTTSPRTLSRWLLEGPGSYGGSRPRVAGGRALGFLTVLQQRTTWRVAVRRLLPRSGNRCVCVRGGVSNPSLAPESAAPRLWGDVSPASAWPPPPAPGPAALRFRSISAASEMPTLVSGRVVLARLRPRGRPAGGRAACALSARSLLNRTGRAAPRGESGARGRGVSALARACLEHTRTCAEHSHTFPDLRSWGAPALTCASSPANGFWMRIILETAHYFPVSIATRPH